MIRPPVAANGCPAASEEPLTLSLERSTAPNGRRVRACACRTPRSSQAASVVSTVAGERLVDLEEVKVLQGEAVAREHARHRERGRHEQALVPVHEVHGCCLEVDEVGEHRQVVGARAQSSLPSSTVEAPSVSGVELPAVIVAASPGLAEGRLEACELLDRRVGAQVGVAADARANGVTRSSKNPRSYAAARFWWLASASSSCASRLMSHAWWSVPGGRPSTGRCAARRCPVRRARGAGADLARWPRAWPRRCGRGRGPAACERSPSQTAIGASEVVSTPPPMADSSWPSLILLARRADALHARRAGLCTSYAGVSADSADPEHGTHASG